MTSFSNFIAEAEDSSKCPPGFVYNAKTKTCEKSSTRLKKNKNTANPGDPPPSLPSFGVWGATGLNGDGYALAQD